MKPNVDELTTGCETLLLKKRTDLESFVTENIPTQFSLVKQKRKKYSIEVE